MSNSTKQFLIILGVLLVIGVGIVAFLGLLVSSVTGGSSETHDVVSGSGDKIAVVELTGVITSSKEVVRQIKKYRKDRSIRAILLHVDSPGGGVVASHEMYDEVRKTRESGKPVIVSMGALAASGGYYVSCAATKIVANPGTLTGSIGVISEFMEIDTLLHKIGVTPNTIKSGKMKDAGSPMRPMNADDRKYFQDLMDNVHRQFIGIVEHERHLDHDSLVALADGRVFTGEQALGLHLVDTLGTYEDAIMIAARVAGIEGTPAIVREERSRSGLLDLLLGEENAKTLNDMREEFLSRPILQYKMATGY